MDTKLVSAVLKMIDRDLMGKIAPLVSDAGTRIQIDYMSRLLLWAATHVSLYDTLSNVRSEDIGRLIEAFSQENCANDENARDECAMLASVGAEGVALRRLAANASRYPGLYARYVAIEQAFVRGMDAQQGNDFGAIYNGGRVAENDETHGVVIDDASLTQYLRRRFPDHGNPDGPTASNVKRLPGGFGKDTILFTIAGCGQLDGDVVMRKDLPISASPAPVTDEYPLLRSLHALGIPVAPPLWAEHDGSALGGIFIVSRRAGGSNDISDWSDDPAARRHCIEKLAEILARIHTLPLAQLGNALAAPSSAREAMQANMLRYYNHYRNRTRYPVDRIETAFAWLLVNLPTSALEPASLLHGDIGFQNMLTCNGEIEAILDWEFSGFGDPAADIGYAWQFIASLTTWEEFGALYESYGGRMPTRATADYFKIWGDVRNACVGIGAAGAVDKAEIADLRSPAAGLGFGPLCEIEALGGTVRFEENHRALG